MCAAVSNSALGKASAGYINALGRLLVVDDHRPSLLKLAAAVTNLGYSALSVHDGVSALERLESEDFDLVLLDIVMPGMSGFEVLSTMKSDARFKHVPVVVISSLNDDKSSVARAIDLGADDFLPKDFDAIVLKARVSAAVERKRLRDIELRYLDQVARLTRAASLLETGSFNPKRLELDDIVAREDGLGKLATVFLSMANNIYERERTLREKVSDLGQSYRLSGLALVMCAAALWATVGVASRLVPHELALPDEIYGFARTIVAGPAILLMALVSGSVPKHKFSVGGIPGFLLFGISCAIFQVCLFRSFTLLGVTITVFLTVCMPPVMAVLWSLWKSGEHISRQVLLALAIAIAGLLTFVRADTASGQPLQFALGLALSLVASAAFVLMTSAARSLSVDHSPIFISGFGLVITSLALAPVAIAVAPHDLTHVVAILGDWRSTSVLIYLGLGPTALAYICYCVGMARCRSAVTGLVASMIEPAVAAGLAFLFLNETLTSWQMFGCFMLLTAMMTLWLDEQKTAPPVASVTEYQT